MIPNGKIRCLSCYVFLYSVLTIPKQILNIDINTNNIDIIKSDYISSKTGTGFVSHGSMSDEGNQRLNVRTGSVPASTRLISVDIRLKESTEHLEYEYNLSNKSHTFNPKKGCLIHRVTRGNTVLWDAKDCGYQYGAKLFVGLNQYSEPVFRVYFSKEELDLEPQESGPKLVSVDIKHKFSNGFFKYKYDSSLNAHKFIPNPSYAFVEATKGNQLIWRYETGDFPECLVVLPDKHGVPILRVLFPRTKKNLPSSERLESDPLEGIEIITEGSIISNDSSKYKIKREKNMSVFVFNSDVKCKEVKYMGGTVWKHGDFGYQEYPKSVSYLTHWVIDVYLDGPFITYEKDANGKWNGKELELRIYVRDPEDPKKIKQIGVDQYDLNVGFEEFEFNLHEGVKCKRVMFGNETLWKYNYEEYPTCITYIESNMVYIFFSNSFLVYVKGKDGEWKEHGSNDIYGKPLRGIKSGSSFKLFKWMEKYY